MTLLFDLLTTSAERSPGDVALRQGNEAVTYEQLALTAGRVAAGLRKLGLRRGDRVAVFLPKTIETVTAMFGCSMAGCVVVPINPLLKGPQVAHILSDCDVSLLVTSATRAAALASSATLPVQHVVIVEAAGSECIRLGEIPTLPWDELCADPARGAQPRAIDMDVAAIFYTSGSTGRPKGVVLSHRNLVTGAQSVTTYVENVSTDRLLAVLPFSFDYGFNQLTSAFLVGASAYLLDYVLPKEVLSTVAHHRITGIAGVPALWMQLAALEWDPGITGHLRYITNSGGAMPASTLARLRAMLPSTRPFLMYGLTEAFRSTYLDPSCVDERPGSIGKAIPNAEVLVVRPDGSPCDPNEPGELVHRGSLVALGYWNDAELTARRFRAAPCARKELPFPEIAVWSGDIVKKDDDGFLYFLGRNDEMIKTSGYRVSPTEIEAVVLETGLAVQVVAVGVPHVTLGHAIAVAVQPAASGPCGTETLLTECRRRLPSYMLPTYVDWYDAIPINPNGKCDRTAIARQIRAKYVTQA